MFISPKLLLPVILVGLFGCARGPEVVLKNPLIAGAVEPNRIVHPAKWAERQSDLPEGALADEATLSAMSEENVCFNVTMRVPDEATLDFARLTGIVKVKQTGQLIRPRVQATAAAEKTYQGLIPEQVQVGTEHACTNSDPNTGACRTWSDTPKYGTAYKRGLVRVREQSAELCFANGGVVTRQSEQLNLELMQNDHRFAAFRWGFPAKP